MRTISPEVRARLKYLYTDPTAYGVWDWDDGEWDWELSLWDALEDCGCGYVAIIPLFDGDRIATKPEPWHTEWAIKFAGSSRSGIPDDLLLFRGSIQEAKRYVDVLIGSDTQKTDFSYPE